MNKPSLIASMCTAVWVSLHQSCQPLICERSKYKDSFEHSSFSFTLIEKMKNNKQIWLIYIMDTAAYWVLGVMLSHCRDPTLWWQMPDILLRAAMLIGSSIGTWYLSKCLPQISFCLIFCFCIIHLEWLLISPEYTFLRSFLDSLCPPGSITLSSP